MAHRSQKIAAKQQKKLTKEIYSKFEDYYKQAGPRLNEYDEADRWMDGDDTLIWSGERRTWVPKVFPNLIESIIRQKVALLTDNKPKIYVYTIPEAEFIDDPKHIEMIKVHSQNMNMAFDHLWRFNKMQSAVEMMALQGASYGLMSGRCYWDQRSNKGIGEIRTEFLNPRNIFFDQAVARVDLLDGSAETLIVAQPKPKSWFRYYFPDIPVEDLPTAEEFQQLGGQFQGIGFGSNENVSDYPVYIEAYHAKDVGEDNPTGKYEVQVTGLAGSKFLFNRSVEFSPVFIHPYELRVDSPMGRGDINRLKTLQKDFCSKLSQVSLNIALSANRQYIVNPAKLGMKLDELLEHSGEPGYYFITKKLTEDVRNAITDLDTPKFNPELFQYLFYLPQLMEQVSGLEAVLKGGSSKKARQSKYEVGKQYEAATIRVRNTAHHMEMMIVDMGKIWAKMINQYYTDPRLIWRVNAETDKLDKNIFTFPQDSDGKNMDLDYVLTVQPDTMLPVDIQSQVERDMNLAQMQAIDPQTLLETMNHPKVTVIMERLKQMREEAQQQGGGQQPGQIAPQSGAQQGAGMPAKF